MRRKLTIEKLREKIKDYWGGENEMAKVFDDDNYSASGIEAMAEFWQTHDICDYTGVDLIYRNSESDAWLEASVIGNIKNYGYISITYNHDIDFLVENADDLLEFIDSVRKDYYNIKRAFKNNKLKI